MKKRVIQIKQELYAHCITYVQERTSRIQKTIADLQEALTSETKSTAGDKHETGRAMLHLEREKAGRQLAEVQKLQQLIKTIDSTTTASQIRLGSIVYTSESNYFIGISIGKIEIDGTVFFAVAPNTPIGKLMVGKTIGDTFMFNEKTYTIQDVK